VDTAGEVKQQVRRKRKKNKSVDDDGFCSGVKGGKQENENEKHVNNALPFHCATHSLIPMSEDTHGRTTCNELVLMLLHGADEKMLLESGNPVFLKLKAELDLLR
jgi:hypothetical protein